ncbi:unnamed protein product, partial [Pleuronectes platessa]
VSAICQSAWRRRTYRSRMTLRRRVCLRGSSCQSETSEPVWAPAFCSHWLARCLQSPVFPPGLVSMTLIWILRLNRSTGSSKTGQYDVNRRGPALHSPH